MPKLPAPPPVWPTRAPDEDPPARASPRQGRRAALVHGDDLDAVEIIRGQPELPAEEAEGAAGHMPAHADPRILAERYDYAPSVEERLERLPHRGAAFDRDSRHGGIVVDALHRRHVDDDAHLGIRDESFEAMPAARDGKPAPLVHGPLDRREHLLVRSGQAHVVGAGAEPPVEPLLGDRAEARIVRPYPLDVVNRLGHVVLFAAPAAVW
jgi:hypothetical protein